MKKYLNHGQEPSGPILSEIDLAIALNYYRQKDEYDFQWVLDVCESFGVSRESLKANKAFVSKTTIALCRLWSLERLPFLTWKMRLSDALKHCVEQQPRLDVANCDLEEAPKKESIVDTYIADIDAIVDVIGYAKIPVRLEIDLTRMTNAEKERLREFYRPKLDEIRSVLNGEDQELVTAYSTTKANLTRIGEFYASLLGTPLHLIKNQSNITTSEDSGVVVKAKRTFKQRKPRAPKFNKLKFLAESKELGLVSVNPLKAHGSTTLVTYNAKYGSVSVYYAKAGTTLSFKRTSIIGFDENKSFSKKANRAKGLLDVLKSGKKIAIIKAIEDVQAKPTAATSVMNEHTILAAAF